MSRLPEATTGLNNHRLRAIGWDQALIGTPERWPESLRAAVDLMLGVDLPSALFIGPELVQLHNQAFDALYRDKAAARRALGRPLKRDVQDEALARSISEVFAGRSVVLRDHGPLDGGVGAQTFNLSCAPVRDEGGDVSAMLVLAFTATGGTRRRDHLVEDLQHRVRNILAMVRSVVARSAETSDTVEDLAAHLDGRIGAFARVQSVLMRNPDAGVDLEGLVRDELLAQNAEEHRLRVDGPRVSLPGKAAEVLTLAIHELATNALKFGALSQASGNLEVTWRLEGTRTAWRLELVWLETGVRVASSAPRREGFGTNLLKRRLPYELSGSADIEFRPGGLVCQIGFPFMPAEDPASADELTGVNTSEDFA